MLAAPGPPSSPPGGGVRGSCGFCSSAMFFSQSKRRFLRRTTGNFSGRLVPAEMSAKCLHLQEVMCQRITENYITGEHENRAVRWWLKELKKKGLKQICELRFVFSFLEITNHNSPIKNF